MATWPAKMETADVLGRFGALSTVRRRRFSTNPWLLALSWWLMVWHRSNSSKFKVIVCVLKLRCCLHVLNPLFLRLKFLFVAFPFQLAIGFQPQLASSLRDPWIHGFFKHGKSDNPPHCCRSMEFPWNGHGSMDRKKGISQSCFLTHRRVKTQLWWSISILAGYILFILAVSQNLVYQNCHCHTESCDEAMDVQGFPIIVFALHFPWGFPLNNPWVFPSFPRVFHHISVVRTV